MRPTTELYQTGSNITLTCSAVSVPPANFSWFVRKAPLLSAGPQLELNNVQKNQSGNYSCQSFNSKTLRYAESRMLPLTFLGTKKI